MMIFDGDFLNLVDYFWLYGKNKIYNSIDSLF